MDTHTRLVGLIVVSLEKAHVIGRDHRHSAASRSQHGGRKPAFLASPTGPGELEEEPVPESLLPRRQRLIESDLPLLRHGPKGRVAPQKQ